MKNKIYDRETLAGVLEKLRTQKKKIAFTNGCFDILHAGHVRYLADARAFADVLVIALNSDASVKRLKGDARPVNTLTDRMTVIAALESADYVTSFNEDTPVETLALLKPDIHVKGGDYIAEKIPEYATVTAYGGTVRIVSFHKGYSTTSIIERSKR
ncbi:MAG: D-glycero-beta-D-manno-heptose 1-phosphate adenylyltransferase [Spirochaetes bacterium]|nr:D-glycero-beta-D-manno-heptose 1-phosphate adenylyltransferase [Spirochaetota bacterium]